MLLTLVHYDNSCVMMQKVVFLQGKVFSFWGRLHPTRSLTRGCTSGPRWDSPRPQNINDIIPPYPQILGCLDKTLQFVP